MLQRGYKMSTATVRKIGSSDYGHVSASCSACDWQGVWHSRRTVEGKRLAERDRDDHNNARHTAATEEN